MLREAGRSFELDQVDLRSHRTQSGGDFFAINPKGQVPALVLDGRDPRPAGSAAAWRPGSIDGEGSELLTEVPAIVQYAADLAPEARLVPPSGTFARYHHEEWLSFIASELHDPLDWLFVPAASAAMRELVRARVADRFHYLADVLDDRAYLMGETFTAADAYLYVVLRWCGRFAIDLALWPAVDEYFLRIDARPSVIAAIAAEGQGDDGAPHVGDVLHPFG